MMLLIPTFRYPFFAEEVVLENVPYRFTFKHNARNDFWTMDIADKDDIPIVHSIKLVIDTFLLQNYPGRGLPPGELVCIDTTKQNEYIGYAQMDSSIQLYYLSEAELATI